MNINSKLETISFDGFIEMINSINNINRKKIVSITSKPKTTNIKLFEVSMRGTIGGDRQITLCSLTGNKLYANGKYKLLNIVDLDKLFIFIAERNKRDLFQSIPMNIIDGNSYSIMIDWNGVYCQKEYGQEMSIGTKELVDYCSSLID